MWKSFVDSNNLYMLRLKEIEDKYDLLLTDLTYIWKSHFSTLNLIAHFQEDNPLIGATTEQIINDLSDIVNNNLHSTEVSIKPLDNAIELTLAKKCNGPVNAQQIVYKCVLNKLEQVEFKNKITVPAIQTIYFLEKQQKMLMNLVQKKDRELEEYKMEKGEITRSDLKTEKFDISTLNNSNDELLLNLFTLETSNDFWQKFTEQNGLTQSTNLHVEVEPWNLRPKRKVTHSGKKVIKKGSGVIFKK